MFPHFIGRNTTKQFEAAASSSAAGGKKKRLKNSTNSENGSRSPKDAARNNKKQFVGAYVRVSSRSQGHAMQRAAIERCATARNDEIGQWFTETLSAGKLARPVLGKVRELAHRGELMKLYVYRLDRLSRSGIRDTLGLVEEFRAVKCELVTVADGFNLEGPASDVVTAMLGWAAQMERLAIGERISAARTRVEAKGGHWGRPARVDPELRAKILAARAEGQTVRFIAARYKVPRSTVGSVVSGKGAYAPIAKPAKKQASKKGALSSSR